MYSRRKQGICLVAISAFFVKETSKHPGASCWAHFRFLFDRARGVLSKSIARVRGAGLLKFNHPERLGCVLVASSLDFQCIYHILLMSFVDFV
jgi:hypothetical protein